MGKSPYPKEFRDEVVELARKPGASVSQLAKDFGITGTTIYEWLKKADVKHGVTADAPPSDNAENRALKKRNRELEQELEVLRRATAYFSQAVLPK